MTVSPDELELAGMFPPVDRDRWRELVKGVLRKSGVATDDTPLDQIEDLLTTTTYDGVAVAPLYTAADTAPGRPGLPGYARAARTDPDVLAGWDVRQRHAHPDVAVNREAVTADLENGVTSLWLVAGEGGIPVEALRKVLADVHLDLAPVVLDAGARTGAAAEVFLGLVTERGRQAEVSGGLGADPLGLAARTGTAASLGEAATLAVRCAGEYPGLRAITVDTTVYHDAGGSDAEELACSLSAGVAYLRALTEAGLSVEQAFGQLEFRYAATADQFLTIAKLRAARRLWARVAEVCGATGEAAGQRQHAVTSSAMMTRRDPWVNMLRTTLACFAAGVAGADAVTVQPFDACLGLPDDFARRIARNTQSLLLEESSLSRVADPAGGSWYVESLTEGLAQAAWDWFTEIEREGGLAPALACGMVSDRIAATRARRDRDIACREFPLTGVSEFPNLGERLPERAPALGTAPAPGGTSPGGRLPRIRYAQAFEALRDRSDAHLAATGARPRIFLATLGPVAAHTARVTFAANLFQAGGIETVTGAPADFASSGARIACICSSDKIYPDEAAPAAATLRAAGALRIWLAGKGTFDGIDGGVFVGCDAVAILTEALDLLDVPRTETEREAL